MSLDQSPDTIDTHIIEEEVQDLIDLAKYFESEALFQRTPQYIEFKFKYDGSEKEIENLAMVLKDRKFYEELVYWLKLRVEKNVRICDTKTRCTMFGRDFLSLDEM